MNIPSNLHYTREHEWVRLIDDSTAEIGITDYAQESLGDITFIEGPSVGKSVAAGESFGVVESVKAASDLFSPVDGEVLETNAALESQPELVNQDPYEAGWMVRIKIRDLSQIAKLLAPEAYEQLIGG
jgi:glycine cleavage system H protein